MQRSFQELQALNAQLHSVREQERTRLARELHDELGQSLTAIKIDVAALNEARRARSGRVSTASCAWSMKRSTQCAGSRPNCGLESWTTSAWRPRWSGPPKSFRRARESSARRRVPETNPPIEAERATALFRIFQETLTNVARHASATQVKVSLSHEGGHLSLKVRDNGRGIGEDQLSASGSLGILGMRERALLLGGELFIGDDSDGGTLVRVRMPRTDRGRAASQ